MTDPDDDWDILDNDGDGLPNGWEMNNSLDPYDATGDNGADGNPDGDGYSNLEEYQYISDPWDDEDPNPQNPSDNDNDGTPDNKDPDDDNDGLTDEQEELIYETDPLRSDMGDDGLIDTVELGFPVQKIESEPPTRSGSNDAYVITGSRMSGTTTNPDADDTDNDGLSDAIENVKGPNGEPWVWWFEGLGDNLAECTMEVPIGVYRLYVQAGKYYNREQPGLLYICIRSVNGFQNRFVSLTETEYSWFTLDYYLLGPEALETITIRIKDGDWCTFSAIISKFLLVKIDDLDPSTETPWQISSRQFTDPNYHDTDYDGLNDGQEVFFSEKTDGTCLPNVWWFEAEDYKAGGTIADISRNSNSRCIMHEGGPPNLIFDPIGIMQMNPMSIVALMSSLTLYLLSLPKVSVALQVPEDSNYRLYCYAKDLLANNPISSTSSQLEVTIEGASLVSIPSTLEIKKHYDWVLVGYFQSKHNPNGDLTDISIAVRGGLTCFIDRIMIVRWYDLVNGPCIDLTAITDPLAKDTDFDGVYDQGELEYRSVYYRQWTCTTPNDRIELNIDDDWKLERFGLMGTCLGADIFGEEGLYGWSGYYDLSGKKIYTLEKKIVYGSSSYEVVDTPGEWHLFVKQSPSSDVFHFYINQDIESSRFPFTALIVDEVYHHADPLKVDSDGDLAGDYHEMMTGMDPCSEYEFPDRDGDRLPDEYEEEVSHTDPDNPDTDGDGLEDGLELFNMQGYKMNPLKKNTDDDGPWDSVEYEIGTDPCTPGDWPIKSTCTDTYPADYKLLICKSYSAGFILYGGYCEYYDLFDWLGLTVDGENGRVTKWQTASCGIGFGYDVKIALVMLTFDPAFKEINDVNHDGSVDWNDDPSLGVSITGEVSFTGLVIPIGASASGSVSGPSSMVGGGLIIGESFKASLTTEVQVYQSEVSRFLLDPIGDWILRYLYDAA